MIQTRMQNALKKCKKKASGKGGFTLVELIVVIVIMGILTAAILPTVTGYVASARTQVEDTNLKMVEEAARLYLTDWEMTNSASSATVTASQLVDMGYLASLPDDSTEYTATFTKVGNHYKVAVEESTKAPSGDDGSSETP